MPGWQAIPRLVPISRAARTQDAPPARRGGNPTRSAEAAGFPLSHRPGDGDSSLSRELVKQENPFGSEANVV